MQLRDVNMEFKVTPGHTTVDTGLRRAVRTQGEHRATEKSTKTARESESWPMSSLQMH